MKRLCAYTEQLRQQEGEERTCLSDSLGPRTYTPTDVRIDGSDPGVSCCFRFNSRMPLTKKKKKKKKKIAAI
jgi:hypothetical protein